MLRKDHYQVHDKQRGSAKISSAEDASAQIPLSVWFPMTAGKTQKYTHNMEGPSSKKKKERNLKSKSVSCVIIKWDNHSGRIS